MPFSPFDFEQMLFNLRQQQLDPNVYSPGFGATPSPPPAVPVPSPQSNRIQSIAAASTPQPQPTQAPTDYPAPVYETAANDRFTQIMNEQPQRKEPGLMRRLGSIPIALSRGGGLDAQEKYKYAPYLREMADWKERLAPAQAGATLERQMNTSLASVYNQGRRLDASEEKNRILNERMLAQNEKDRAGIDIQRRAQDLKETIARRPDLTWKLDEDGEIVGLDDHGGPVVRSGIKSGELTDAQKINMGLSAALTRIEKAGDVRAGLIGLQGEIDIKRDAAKEAEQRVTAGSKPMLPTQQRVELFNRAQQLFNTDPDARNYITLGQPGTSDFQLKVPSAIRQATKDAYRKKYEEIAKKIYGDNWQEAIRTQGSPGAPGITPSTGAKQYKRGDDPGGIFK